MTTTKRIAALTVTALALLAPTAQAAPHPYERGKSLSVRVDTITDHAAKSPKGNTHAKPIRIHWADRGERQLHPYGKGSFIPRPGSDGTNRLCRSNSKARRIAC
jgi:hypothetical protein